MLYSTGSVLCIWKDKLQKGEEIIVTDPEATRYFWTLNQAVDLIFDCMENATTSHFHFPSMKSMSMGDLLDAMAEKYLPEGKELNVKTIGLQVAPKHTCLLYTSPSPRDRQKSRMPSSA